MTMKPVLRQYAFENPDVPHGKQWVLKVRSSRTAAVAGSVAAAG
jgi:hypothetical protein